LESCGDSLPEDIGAYPVEIYTVFIPYTLEKPTASDGYGYEGESCKAMNFAEPVKVVESFQFLQPDFQLEDK
jgi:hypothetical protein